METRHAKAALASEMKGPRPFQRSGRRCKGAQAGLLQRPSSSPTPPRTVALRTPTTLPLPCRIQTMVRAARGHHRAHRRLPVQIKAKKLAGSATQSKPSRPILGKLRGTPKRSRSRWPPTSKHMATGLQAITTCSGHPLRREPQRGLRWPLRGSRNPRCSKPTRTGPSSLCQRSGASS